MKDSIVRILELLPIGEDFFRVAAVQFSNTAQVEFDLDDTFDRDVAIGWINGLTQLNSYTRTSLGIRTAMEELSQGLRGDRPEVRDIQLVITDGQSNRDAALTIPTAHEASYNCITMLVLGVTSNVNEAEISGLLQMIYNNDNK